MTVSGDSFKEIVKSLADVSKSLGYTKKGNAFFRTEKDTRFEFGLRKSRDTTSDVLYLTAYMLASVLKLDQFYRTNDALQMIRAEDFEWGVRNLLGRDHLGYWVVQSTSDVKAAVTELTEALHSSIIVSGSVNTVDLAIERMSLCLKEGNGAWSCATARERMRLVALYLSLGEFEKAVVTMERLKEHCKDDSNALRLISSDWVIINNIYQSELKIS